jgi:hypothetical protein
MYEQCKGKDWNKVKIERGYKTIENRGEVRILIANTTAHPLIYQPRYEAMLIKQMRLIETEFTKTLKAEMRGWQSGVRRARVFLLIFASFLFWLRSLKKWIAASYI